VASSRATLERLSGFGGAQTGVSRVLRPRSISELEEIFRGGRREFRSLALRGAGRSYGDAALNDGGAALDLTLLDRIEAWDPERGVAEVQPGVTIDKLWRRTLPDGYWPTVVPGTSLATLGGVVAMNGHGKNCFRVGPIGDQIDELEILLPTGERLCCGPEQSSDLFSGVVAGFGMLGCVTRIRLRLKRVHSGYLNVRAVPAGSIGEMVDVFEENVADADYLVGWCDGLASPGALGGGVVHRGDYLAEGEDPDPAASLRPEAQDLSPRMLGAIPRSQLWRILRVLQTWPAMRLVNLAKHLGHRFDPRAAHRWRHTEFGFLLDYAPGFNRSYGPAGLIQVQPFVPADRAVDAFDEILRLARRRGLPPYLVVFKQHRADRFLLSHGLDGYSLAMDFPARRRRELWALAREIQDLAIEAGGRFYFAKDSTLTPEQRARCFPEENLRRFAELRRKCDPEGWLQTDLARRVWPDLFGS
jgi:FAD/FMN-containing dehydrogenase